MSSKSLIEHNMETRSLSEIIKAEALRLGFFACGIAKAEPVDESTSTAFKQWINDCSHANMHYLANNIDKRLDPTLLMTNAKSIISVALNYTPKNYIPKSEYQIAAYAYGQDYHDIMKDKLRQLAAVISSDAKICCDTVPILERYWAEKAGIGWIGRNHQLIIPQAGSMFFLGEIITDIEMDYDQPGSNHCGNCHACIDSCPTGALSKNSNKLDAGRCLSYQTIENREDIPISFHNAMGNCIYGCDRCLKACPHNQYATPCQEERLQPKEMLLEMKKEDWQQLSLDDYRKLFKGSAVKRAKYEGLMRNIGIVKNNDTE